MSFYRNPTQCYDKGPWKTFSSHIGDILVIFQKNKLDHTEKDVQETTGLLQGQWTGTGASKIKLKNANKKRTVTVRRVIFF